MGKHEVEEIEQALNSPEAELVLKRRISEGEVRMVAAFGKGPSYN